MVVKKEEGQLWINMAALIGAMLVHAVVVVVFFYSTFQTKAEAARMESSLRIETSLQFQSIKEDLLEIKAGLLKLDERQHRKELKAK